MASGTGTGVDEVDVVKEVGELVEPSSGGRQTDVSEAIEDEDGSAVN